MPRRNFRTLPALTEAPAFQRPLIPNIKLNWRRPVEGLYHASYSRYRLTLAWNPDAGRWFGIVFDTRAQRQITAVNDPDQNVIRAGFARQMAQFALADAN